MEKFMNNWTAKTTCEQCGSQWLHGVEHNEHFICPDCVKINLFTTHE